MNREGKDRAPGVALYVFSGVHLGARLELQAGTWVLGADDSCDIILNGLAPRHALLDIAPAPNGECSVRLSALDGEVSLQDGRAARPAGPGEASPRLDPAAGSGWHLGQTCFAWNLPDAEQPVVDPQARTPASDHEAVGTEAGAPEALSAGSGDAAGAAAAAVSVTSGTSTICGATGANLVGRENAEALPERGKMVGGSSASLPALMSETVAVPKKRGSGRRFILLALVVVLLTAMSVVLTPSDNNPQQYQSIVGKYLAEAGLSGLAVTPRGQGVEVRGAVDDDAAMLRLRDVARALHFPVYLEVGVREDIVRAVRSSLGIRGFHPEVSITEDGGASRLTVAAYMKDAILEEAAFAALQSEVKGLPVADRRIVHEKELVPVLEEALKAAGLVSARVICLPGRVDFAGDFQPDDLPVLARIRGEAERRFGVPLYGESTLAAAMSGVSAGREGQSDETDRADTPLRAAARGSRAEADGDPLGGLTITGVTMLPMRFVVTADGRRLFEGAKLPSGCILESISTRVLMLRRGDHMFTYRLRGSHD